MKTQYSLGYATLILLILLTSCAPNLAPGVDLSGKNLKGRDLRGVDLSGANLSSTNLSNAILGLGGEMKPEQVFEGITCAQWIMSSSMLALCDKESVKIWDADKKAFVQTIDIPDDQDSKVLAISPDGNTLFLQTLDSMKIEHFWLLDTKTNTKIPVATDQYTPYDVGYLVWSPDSSFIAMSEWSDTWVWDVAKNTLVDSIRHTFNRSWSNDGRTLVYEGLPDTDENPNTTLLELWDVPTNNRDRTLVVQLRTVNEIDWSPDDKFIVTMENFVPEDYPQGEILEVETGAHVRFLENLTSVCKQCSLTSLAWSPAHPLIAGGISYGNKPSDDSQRIVFWDAETGSILFDFDAGDNIISLQWSESGRYLLSNHSQIWDIEKVFETVNLAGANLMEADLSGANLAGLDLTTVKLTGAKLSGTNLRGANLSGMDLRTVTLNSADLSGANLANSDLSGVNLSGAIVNQTNFDNTNLTGADLVGVRPIEYLLKTVCQGIGIAQMPSYEDQPGIHPLLLMEYGGRLHRWNDEVFEKWQPSNEHLPEIVACIGEFKSTTLGYCHYIGAGGTSTVSRRQTSLDITLREARSGSIIASTTIYGPLVEECPLNIVEGTKDIGRNPQFSDAEGWLSKYVEK